MKIYEDGDCYLEHEKVIKIHYFMLECLKCGKISLFIADYSKFRFPTMFAY